MLRASLYWQQEIVAPGIGICLAGICGEDFER
jgi:hypothetical protein